MYFVLCIVRAAIAWNKWLIDWFIHSFIDSFIHSCFPVTYLQLEDVTCPFRHPCIMDIKMGQITYAPDAEPDKVAKELAKYPPAKDIGFQLVGTRVRKYTYHQLRWKRINCMQMIGSSNLLPFNQKIYLNWLTDYLILRYC